MCELHRQYKYTSFIVLNFSTDARIDAIAMRAATAVNCKQSIRVHIVPDLPSAVMTGFFHPIIVLPKQDMELEDHKIEYILRHEIAHFVGGDTWYKLISQILVCILWWNPVIYLFRRSIEQLLELRSDALACSTLSNVEKGEYTAVLLTVAKRSFKALSTLRSTGFIGIRKSLYFKHRISILLSPKEPKRASWLTALIVCLSIVLYLGSYTFIVQPAALPPDAEAPGFYVPTPDTTYLVPIDSGQYEVWVNGVCIATISAEAAKTEPFNQFPIYEKEN